MNADSCEIFLHCYTLPHDSGKVIWFHVGHPCVHPSDGQTDMHTSVLPYFHFRMDNNFKFQWIFTKPGVCIDSGDLVRDFK